MNRNIIFLLIFLFFISCNVKISDTEKGKILLKISDNTNDSVFEKNFELEIILPVETTNEYLFSQVERVILHDDKAIILAPGKEGIFVVNINTGKVLTHIHRVGQGPGDSNNILDIAFDENKSEIIVFNDYEKLLFFDLQGNFLKEVKIGKLYENIIYLNGNIIFNNIGFGYSCQPYVLDIYDLNTEKLTHKGNNIKLDFPFKNFGRSIVKSKNIWLSARLDFNMYKVTIDGFENPYVLDMDTTANNELRKKQINSEMDFQTFLNEILKINRSFHSVSSIRETDNFMVFKPNNFGLFFMNKQNSEVYREGRITDSNLGLSLLNYFPHDGDDNRIMFVIRAVEWLQRLPAEQALLPQYLVEKIRFMEVKEDDNPILLFYKEK